MTLIRIHEVTALMNDSRCSNHGKRVVLWTGRNTRKAVAEKAMARIRSDYERTALYSGFRVESRDEECEVL